LSKGADSPKPGETTGYNGGTYDPAESNAPWEDYQDYGHNHWHNSLFVADGINNFSIRGSGLIHGKGLSRGTRSSLAECGSIVFRIDQPVFAGREIGRANNRATATARFVDTG